VAAIFKVKQKAACEHEEYLMGALRRMATDLLCKLQLSRKVHCIALFVGCLIASLGCTLEVEQ
jgi:hypothetical protein